MPDELSNICDLARQHCRNCCLPRQTHSATPRTHSESGADPWLIAHAIHNRGVVVTHESTKHPQAKAARIPDVCDAFKVPCIDTYEMLDRLGADFKPNSQKKSK